MSNRYWINDGGNWNDSSHWSETSGGVSGATVPTSGDSVYFNDLSFTGTSIITINATANCCDFIWTGITQNVSLTNSAYNLSIYGSLVLDAKLSTSFTSTGYLYFKSTSIGKDITSNGNTSSWNKIIFNGVGGGWNNQDDWNVGSSVIQLYNGTWNTNGKTISLITLYILAGTKTLTLGDSTINLGSYSLDQPAGLTLNYDTSTFNFNKSGAMGIYSIGTYVVDFYNVIFTNPAAITSFFLSNNITINNNLTITGNNDNAFRYLIYSYTLGTQKTITCNETVSATNVDFRDINFQNTIDLSSISGGSGDCGGNSGITFTSGQTQYFYTTGLTASWSNSNNWFLNSSGITSGRVPLPQDNAIFDENSFSTGCTLTVDCPRIGGNINLSGITKSISFNLNNNVEIYGDFIFSSNAIYSGIYTIYLVGLQENNYSFDTYSKTFYSIAFWRGIYINLSDVILSYGLTVHRKGNFYLNDYNMSGLWLVANDNLYTGAYFDLGNGTISISGIKISEGLYYSLVFHANVNINASNATIIIQTTYSGNYSISSANKIYKNFILNNSSTGGTHYFNNDSIITNFVINAGVNAKFVTGTKQTVGKLTAIGTSESGITIASFTTGTTFTLSGSTSDWLVERATIRDTIVSPPQYAGYYSTDGGNNTGWTFGDSSARYWVGDTGSWNDTSHWSYETGGATGATIPTSGQSVFFDANSFSGTSIITINATANCNDFIWTGITQSVTLTNSAYNFNVYGDLTLCSGLTWSFTSTGYLYFKNSSISYITSNGITMNSSRIYFDGTGEWINQDDWNTSSNSAVYHLKGTWRTNDKYITVGILRNDGISNPANLYLGDSTLFSMVFLGQGGGTPSLYNIYASGSTIKTYGYLRFNGNTSLNNVIIGSTNTAGVDGDVFNNSGMLTIKNLTVERSGSYRLFVWIHSNLTITNSFIINGNNSSNLRTLISSYTVGTQYKMTINSGHTFSNVDFRDIYLSGSSIFDLSSITGGSGDCGGNSGITFTSGQTQYYYHTGSTTTLWSDSTKWFIDSGHTLSGRVPLPQDDVIFDENSFSTGCTLTVDCPRIGGNLDMSAVNQLVTMNLTTYIEQYGSHILGNDITPSGNYSRYLYGRGSHYYNTFGKTTWAFQLYAFGGTYINMSDIFVTGTAGLNFSYGSFDMNDYNFTYTTDGVTINAGATLYMGNGIFWPGRAVGQAFWIVGAIYAENSTLKMGGAWGSSDISYNLNGKTLNNVIVDNLSTGYVIIQGSNNINRLDIIKNNKVKFTNGTVQTINDFTAIGTSSSGITIGSVTSGSTHTLSGITSDWLVERAIIQDSIVSPPQYAGFYSTDGGNNTGWTFGESSARYWVGNTGNWNDTSHWSYETGGATGATIPGSGQTVFFDSNSFSGTSTVTINSEANCNHFIWTGITQSVTLVNASHNLNVYGDLTLCSGLTWSFTATGYLFLKATTDCYITSNGITMNGNIYLDGVGGSWTNMDDWNCSTSLIRPYNGTWNTNDKTITCLQIRFQTGASTMNCGNSTITGLQQFWADNGTHDFNCDTSTFIFNANLAIPNFTFAPAYNVIIKGSADINYYAEVWSNINILNDLTLSGYNSTNYRSIIRTPTYGTKSSITVGGSVTVSNFDFMDIIGVGSGWDLSNAEGGSGDCGGNSGITFTSGQTQYWYQGSGSWSDSSKWFLDSSGITSGRTPLPQDDTIFDENSFSGGTSIITASHSRLGKNLNMSGVTNTVNLLLNNGVYIFGDLILGNNIEQTGNNSFYLFGRDNLFINLYGKTIYSLYCYAPNSIVNVLSDLNISVTLSIGNCYFYFNDFDSYVGYLSYPANSYKYGYVYMGSGTMTLNRTNSYFQTSASQHLYTEQSTIKFVAPYLSNDYGYINCGTAGVLKTFNNIWITGEKNSYIDLTGVFTINELIVDKGKKVRFTNGTNTTLNSLVTNGTSYSGVTLCSYLSGSTYTLTKTSGTSIVDVKYATISDSIANGLYARASIDGGNNSGWTFNQPKFWIGGSGDTNDIAHWSDTSGGASGTTFMGPETVVGGNFESGLIGTRTDGGTSVSTWTLNTTSPISGTQDGLLDITVPYSNRPTLLFPHSTVLANRWIRFSFDYKANSGDPSITYVYNGSAAILIGSPLTGTGTFYYDLKYVTDRSQLHLYFSSSTPTQIQLDNISVKEIYLLPTPSTDVFFDENSFTVSGQTVSINEQLDCFTLDFEDLSNSMTLSNSAYNLNVYGSLFLSDKLNTSFTSVGYLNFKAVDKQWIVSSGTTISWNRIIFDGVGGEWINQDDWNALSTPYLTNGHWNHNDKNVSTYGFLWGVGTKTLTLGSGTFDTKAGNAFFHINFTNATFNCGTSLIKNSNVGGGSGFYAGPFIFYDIEVYAFYVPLWSSTFHNVTINYQASGGHAGLGMEGGILTIDNEFNIFGYNSTNRRVTAVSNVFGTQRRIICNGTVDATNVNFRDIYLSGETIFDLSSIPGGSGDLGGNSGITFTSGQTQYYYTTGSTTTLWSDTNKWFIDSGYTLQGRVPLAQDSAIFNESSFSTGCTLTADCSTIGSLDMLLVDKNISFVPSSDIYCYGSFIVGDYVNLWGSLDRGLIMLSRNLSYLNTQNSQIRKLFFYTIGESCIIQSDLSLYEYIGFGVGNVNLNNNNVTAPRVASMGAYGSVWMGSGTIELTYGLTSINVWEISTSTTLYTENSIIKFTPSSWSSNIQFRGGDKIYNKIWFSGAHIGNFDIGYSNTFNNILIDPGRKVRFTEGTTQIIKYLNAIGTSDSGITIGSVTTGLTHTLSGVTNNWAVEYATISDSITSPSQNAGMYSTDGGNNTGWTFGSSNVRYWVGGTGNWNDPSHWAYISNGGSGATIPTSGNSVYFDSNSFSGTSTVTIDNTANCYDMNWSGITQNVTLTSSAYNLNIYGSLLLWTGLTWTFTGTAYVYLKSTFGNNTITTNGVSTYMNQLYFDGVGGSWINRDNFTLLSVSYIYLLNGTWNTNNYDITSTSSRFQTGTGTKSLILGSSYLKFTALYNIGIADFTLDAGTSTIEVSDFFLGVSTFTTRFYNVYLNGVGAINGTGGFYCQNLNRTSGSNIGAGIYLQSDVVVDDTLTLQGLNSTNYRLLVYTALGAQRKITANNISISNVDFRDIYLSGSTVFDLSSITGGSGDCGGNSGITFTSGQTQYFYTTGTTASWSDSNNWFLNTSGITQGRVPLPQDIAIFDENSFLTGCTLNVDCRRLSELDMSLVATPITMSLSNEIECYGDFILGDNINTSYGYYLYLYGRRNDHILNTYNKTIHTLYNQAYGGTYTLMSNLTLNGIAFYQSVGTFDFNDFDAYVQRALLCSTGTITYLGNGTISTGNRGTSGQFFMASGTIYAENSTIKAEPNNGLNYIFDGMGKTFNNLWLSGTHTGYYDIAGNNTFNQILIDDGRKVRFTNGTTQTFNSLISRGTPSSGITITTTTTGSTFTLYNSFSGYTDVKYTDISYSIANNLFARASIDSGNNTGWTFNVPRFWVGDSGNITDPAHWALTSGGVSGETTPTSANDIFFDENSFSTGSTITVNNTFSCGAIDFEGINQNVSLINSAYNFNVYGSLTFWTGLTTTFTSTGYLYFKSTYHQFLRTSGVTTNFNKIYFNGSNGYWTNVDDWNCGSSSLYLANGSWNTNGFNITTSSTFIVETGTKTLTLGNSVFTLGGSFSLAGSGSMTMNSETSTIICGDNFNGYGKTFYNVVLNRYADARLIGANTFNNLTRSPMSTINGNLLLEANQIVNGDFIIDGYNSANYRMLVASYYIGGRYTITCNGSISASNVDFRDIEGSGTASWDLSNITGGSGDCGGNSGITFTSGQTQYFYTTGSTVSWSSVSNWFLNSSGITQGRVPLPQDDAIFDENSFNQATTTLTIDCARIGKSLNMSSVSKSVSITFSNSTETYGDYILGSNISTPFANNSRTLMGRDNYTIKTFNTVPYYFNINGYGGSYTLQSDFLGGSINGGSILFNLYSGSTLYLNDYNLETGRLNIAGNLYCGGGEIKIKQYNAFAGFTSTGTIYSENSTIKFVPDSPTSNSPKFEGGNKTYNKLWLSGSHTGYYDITGSNTFNEILIDPGRKARFESGKTQTSKYFNAIGISGNTISIGSTATGSTHSLIRTNNWYLDYCVIQDSVVSPDTNAGYSSIDNGNNSGWTFNISNLKYWIGESGDWGDSSHWSYSIGGASGATLPTPSDKVFFNEYSFSSPSSIDINVDADCYDMLWTGVTQSVTISNTGHTLNIYKDIALYSGITWNFSETGYLYLKSVIDSYIITNGSILNVNRLYFDGDNNWVNLDDLNLGSSDIYHESGNWLTSGKTITTTGKYYTTGSTLKYLDLSTSTLNLGSYIDDYGVQLSAGTSQINISDFNSIFKGYDNTFYNVKFINGAYIYGDNIFNNLEISNDNNIDYKLQLYGNQTINGILTLSGKNSTNYRLLITSDEFNVQRSLFASDVLAYNVDFRDIVGDGSFDWDLSMIVGGSGDWGGNSGITFTMEQDQYLYSTGDTINWSDNGIWFLGSGGSGGSGRMPLAQDNVIIDESFTSTLEGYLNFDIGDKIYCKDFDCYDINKFLYIIDNGDIPINIKGNLYLSPMFEFEQRTNIIKLVCRDSSTASLENSLLGIVSFLYGDYTIYGNTECESFQVYSDAKVTIYSQEIEITGEYSPALYIGGNNSYDTTSWCDGTTFKIDETGSSNIQIQPFSNDANCNIWLTGSITGDYEIKSDIPATTYYINYLLVDPGKSIKTSSGLTINFNNFSAVGTVESGITIGTIESGYTSTFNYTGPIVNKPVIYGQYLSISDSVATPSSIWYAGPTSTDLGNNSGWIFSLRGRLILYDSKLVLNKPTSSHPLLFTNHFLL